MVSELGLARDEAISSALHEDQMMVCQLMISVLLDDENRNRALALHDDAANNFMNLLQQVMPLFR
jgi:hypothetical protein